MTLRTRLFFSHAAVILLTLVALTAALFLLLAQLQASRNALNLAPDLARVARNMRQAMPAASAQAAFGQSVSLVQLPRRLLLLDGAGNILDDSLDTPQIITSNRLDLSKAINPNADMPALLTRERVVTGEFLDTRNTRWEFIAVNARASQTSGEYVAVTRPINTNPLLDVVEEAALGRLAMAGLIALVFAGGIAALVARSLSHPIQQVAKAANAIAQGHYDERVTLSGSREFHQLASDFNEMAGQVQAAQRRERDFLANVTHELKTPLTTILGFAQALGDGMIDEPRAVQKTGGVIYDEANRLRQMVGGLLEGSRLESGQAQLEHNRVNIADVLGACAARFELRAKSVGVALDCQPQQGLFVLGDGDRLAQVFANLMDNALKFAKPGDEIRISSAATPSMGVAGVEVIVADTGAGILPEDLPRIFDRFFQSASASRDGGGVGLGLAISKQIVEAHGGHITAKSEPGKGTTMRVWLPSNL